MDAEAAASRPQPVAIGVAMSGGAQPLLSPATTRYCSSSVGRRNRNSSDWWATKGPLVVEEEGEEGGEGEMDEGLPGQQSRERATTLGDEIDLDESDEAAAGHGERRRRKVDLRHLGRDSMCTRSMSTSSESSDGRPFEATEAAVGRRLPRSPRRLDLSHLGRGSMCIRSMSISSEGSEGPLSSQTRGALDLSRLLGLAALDFDDSVLQEGGELSRGDSVELDEAALATALRPGK